MTDVFVLYAIRPIYLTGDLNVAITNDKNQPIPVEVEDNGDGTYSVAYTPSSPGPLKVNVLYAGKLVPKSPIAVQVQPHVDVSKVKVEGLDPSKLYTLIVNRFYR